MTFAQKDPSITLFVTLFPLHMLVRARTCGYVDVEEEFVCVKRHLLAGARRGTCIGGPVTLKISYRGLTES